MTQEVAKAINNVSKRLNEVQNQMDSIMRMLTNKNSADIDYLAMMTDIEIPIEDSDEEEVTE